MLKTYQAKLAGPVPAFPADMEKNIAEYLDGSLAEKVAKRRFDTQEAAIAENRRAGSCTSAVLAPAANACEQPLLPLSAVYQRRDGNGRIVFTNE
jgi:hypothetical protein